MQASRTREIIPGLLSRSLHGVTDEPYGVCAIHSGRLFGTVHLWGCWRAFCRRSYPPCGSSLSSYHPPNIPSLLASLHSLPLRIRDSGSCPILLDTGLHCVSVCLFLFSLTPGEIVPEIWVSLVSKGCFSLLLLRLTISKHSQKRIRCARGYGCKAVASMSINTEESYTLSPRFCAKKV